MVKEVNVQSRIMKYLRAQPNCHVRKVHGSKFQSGEPDLDCVLQGRSVKLEVKSPTGSYELTPLQARRLQQWREAGAITGCVTGVDQVEALLRQHGWNGQRWVTVRERRARADGDEFDYACPECGQAVVGEYPECPYCATPWTPG